MSIDNSIAIVGYVLLAGVWAFIGFLTYEIVRRFRSRRRLSASLLSVVVAGLLVWGLFLGVTPGSGAFHRFLWTDELFGQGFSLPAPRLSFTTGGLIEVCDTDVYDLPESLVGWLRAPPPKFLTDFPEEWPGSRFRRVAWHPTPVGSEDEKMLEMTMLDPDAQDSGDVKALRLAQELLRRLAQEPGNYVAYQYRNDEGFESVHFYLVSPTARVLIKTNW